MGRDIPRPAEFDGPPEAKLPLLGIPATFSSEDDKYRAGFEFRHQYAFLHKAGGGLEYYLKKRYIRLSAEKPVKAAWMIMEDR